MSSEVGMKVNENSSHFLIRRIHSLMGLLPIGIFLTFHLCLNLSARFGPETYDKVIAFMQSIPGIFLIEVVVIFIPIAFHAIYGTYVVYTGQSNVLRYRYVRNWLYIIQRISGIVTVLFVVYHVVLIRFGDASFAGMQGSVSTPIGFIFNLLGIILSIFHFTNGLWAFAITWGITVGPRAQKIWTYVCGVIFVLMSIIGTLAITAFV